MILEKYKGKTTGDFLLPVFPIMTYNRQLKRIAKLCQISKNMSSHLARHTFATLALTKGVSIESVSKMLGHTNINTTQIYARITDRKVGNEMKVFAGNVKQLDSQMQLTVAQKDVPIEDIFKSLKINANRTSDIIWKNLTEKVWNSITTIERHTFYTTIENMNSKPKTMCDFYVILIDYFLENVFSPCDNNVLVETAFTNTEYLQ